MCLLKLSPPLNFLTQFNVSAEMHPRITASHPNEASNSVPLTTWDGSSHSTGNLSNWLLQKFISAPGKKWFSLPVLFSLKCLIAGYIKRLQSWRWVLRSTCRRAVLLLPGKGPRRRGHITSLASPRTPTPRLVVIHMPSTHHYNNCPTSQRQPCVQPSRFVIMLLQNRKPSQKYLLLQNQEGLLELSTA